MLRELATDGAARRGELMTPHGAVATPASWTWEEFQALPSEDVTTDIHCVTKWSKLDTVWEGVSVDTLLGFPIITLIAVSPYVA